MFFDGDMSCGLICVCSLVGNIPDVIDEHTGFGFEEGTMIL